MKAFLEWKMFSLLILHHLPPPLGSHFFILLLFTLGYSGVARGWAIVPPPEPKRRSIKTSIFENFWKTYKQKCPQNFLAPPEIFFWLRHCLGMGHFSPGFLYLFIRNFSI